MRHRTRNNSNRSSCILSVVIYFT